MVHLVGFTIEIYYDAWTYEHQIKLKLSLLSHRACCYTCYMIQLMHFVTL